MAACEVGQEAVDDLYESVFLDEYRDQPPRFKPSKPPQFRVTKVMIWCLFVACFILTALVALLLVFWPHECPTDWLHINQQCYLHSARSDNFESAFNDCHQRNANVSITCPIYGCLSTWTPYQTDGATWYYTNFPVELRVEDLPTEGDCALRDFENKLRRTFKNERLFWCCEKHDESFFASLINKWFLM
ncbi:C-type lectin protein [Ranid herpesvirus 3]|uniref:C-type lectin protein n=1 Tax=Ranid herpesvirus 3 TaxID=1987509 RepID=A0A1X9T5I9_9VIRU|nr:C-type lectin protein [Ranid herpesvirus 3]ARR28957.1 C-type lectin protein [Ranid herpesvirus 3]